MIKSSAVLSKSESEEIAIFNAHPGVGVIMIEDRGAIVMGMMGMVPNGSGDSSRVRDDTLWFVLFPLFSFQYGSS